MSGLAFTIAFCVLPLGAQKGTPEPRAGLEYKAPKGWTELPGGGDRHATMRLHAAPRALAGKDAGSHTPILRVMFFASGGDPAKDVVDGLPRMTPYRSLEDFALRGLGIKDANKEPDKLGAVACQRVTGKNAQRTLYGVTIPIDGGEAAVCFEVLTNQFDKLKKEFDATIASIAQVAQVAGERHDPPWVNDSEWSKKEPAARSAARKAWVETAVTAATRNADGAFKPSKSKYWTVLSAADPAFTKKVSPPRRRCAHGSRRGCRTSPRTRCPRCCGCSTAWITTTPTSRPSRRRASTTGTAASCTSCTTPTTAAALATACCSAPCCGTRSTTSTTACCPRCALVRQRPVGDPAQVAAQ